MDNNTFTEMTEEIKTDEGVVNEVYLDHLGLPTVGVGHLIREDDPEYGLDVGTQVGEERVAELETSLTKNLSKKGVKRSKKPSKK